jgi:hypothetical protein
MKTIGSLLGKCCLCNFKIHNNDGWINQHSVSIESKWICGECLANLEPATKEAGKRYRQEIYTPKKHKVKNTYNVTVDPITGKLKRESFK